MIYLELADLLHVAERTLGGNVAVRDLGLLESAVARPRATMYGRDAYPTLPEKAAAMLHSIAKNRALIEGNKRFALAATIVLVGINGFGLTYTNDEANQLIMAVAAGGVDDVTDIVGSVGAHLQPW